MELILNGQSLEKFKNVSFLNDDKYKNYIKIIDKINLV